MIGVLIALACITTEFITMHLKKKKLDKKVRKIMEENRNVQQYLGS